MKKALGAIQNILTVVLFIVALCMMIFTIISVTTVNQNDRNLFGYKMFKVMSDSMKATDFEAGDLIISKVVDPTTLQEGDIITFSSNDIESFGEVITHKIRSKTVDENGDPGFITYGTTTGVDDASIVTYPYILGKYVRRIPKMGYFFDFLKTTPGYIMCILIPFLLLIISRGIATVNTFREYKQEQMAAMEAEKAEIARERENSQKMMEEILALKSQLAAQAGTADPQVHPEASEGKPEEEVKDQAEEEPGKLAKEKPQQTEANQAEAGPAAQDKAEQA